MKEISSMFWSRCVLVYVNSIIIEHVFVSQSIYTINIILSSLEGEEEEDSS